MSFQFLKKLESFSREKVSSAQKEYPGEAPSQDKDKICRTETYTVGPGDTEVQSIPDYRDSTSELETGGTSGSSYIKIIDEVEERTRRVCEEPQEGGSGTNPKPVIIPAEYEWKIDKNLGWNAGARSVDRLDGNLYLSFRVDPGSRLGVGLARGRFGNHFRNIPFSFFFHNRELRIYEAGEEVFGPVSYKLSDSYQIVRINGEIVYKQNEQVIYRSAKVSNGSLVVVSAMYTGADRVI